MIRDVVIIGAGQAGLSAGRRFTVAGRTPLLLEAAGELGQSWRTRWDSLRLFTSAQYSALPGLPFPGDPDRYPGKDEVADYLGAYAEHFSLQVRLNSPVRQLSHDGATFALATPAGVLQARRVVVATGPFQRPVTPDHQLTIPSVHTSEYRNPGQLPDGPTVVVGGGNSGVQIAAELAASGRRVTLAIGNRLPTIPQRLLGRDIFGWLDALGLMDAPSDGFVGSLVKRREPLIGIDPRDLRRLGVALIGRVIDANGETIHTADGPVDAAAVIWATGFRLDHSWIDIPGAVSDGRPVHVRGAGVVPGLDYLGLPYQYNRGSALIGWVGKDADRLGI